MQLKNVGFEAISQVVKERDENGKFKSISDFINRVNPRNINKLQLEGLVKAGAFDSIFSNRKNLFENIPNIIQHSKTIYENKAQNQSSLFSDDAQKVSYLMNGKNLVKWDNNVLLSKEFESVGFYLSNHPLEDFKDALDQYKTKSYKEFENSSEKESFVAGTVMSIKEKKTTKGTPFAIIKFSDQSKVFELFLFSEVLELNRKHLIEGKSFLLTIIKDKEHQDNRFRRVNVRKIVSLEEITKLNYANVHIEIETSKNLEKLYESIKEKGNSKIKISIIEKDKNLLFELSDKRKFDYKTLKYLNQEPYIKKISV